MGMKGHRFQVVGYSFLLFVLLSTIYGTLYPVFAASDIGQSRITPASPFYFLKAVRENLELKFAGTTRVQALRQLEFATRRIREVNSLVKTPRQDLIESTLERYLSHLKEAQGLISLRDENLARNVTEDVTWQMGVLQTVYGQVSDIGAKRSVRHIVNRLSEWDGQLIDKLISVNQPALVQKVVASKLSGCNFLSRESSTSGLNEVERIVLTERAKVCFQGSEIQSF